MSTETITDRQEDAPRSRRNRPPAHPGRILKNLYLVPLGVSNTELAKVLGVSRKAISSIVNEHKSVTPEMALRLSRAFPNTAPEFWLNLQKTYALWHAARDSLDWQKVHPIAQDVPDSPIGYPDLSEQRVSGLNALREDGTQSRAEETQRGTEKDRGRE